MIINSPKLSASSFYGNTNRELSENISFTLVPSNWCVVHFDSSKDNLWWVGWHSIDGFFRPCEGFQSEKAAKQRCNSLNRMRNKRNSLVMDHDT